MSWLSASTLMEFSLWTFTKILGSKFLYYSHYTGRKIDWEMLSHLMSKKLRTSVLLYVDLEGKSALGDTIYSFSSHSLGTKVC